MRYIDQLISHFEKEYPEALCSLDYTVDWQLLFATRLAAQCTDERVNKVTPSLFSRYPTLEAFAEAKLEDVEAIIHPCGFFRTKARDLIDCAKILIDKFGGRVPGEMEQLLSAISAALGQK